jgi:F0F1-type ATP synthase delta subunit
MILFKYFTKYNVFLKLILQNHRLDLVALICKKYLKIQLNHVAKPKN